MTGGPAARLAKGGGLIIVVLSLLFIADRLIQTRIWELAQAKGTALTAGILAAGLGCGLSAFLLSGAWLKILRWCGQPDAPALVCLGIYGRTQIAKYVPGNVFHFIGRHLAGRRHGFAHLPMVMAALLEAVGMVLAAALMALVGTLFWLDPGVGLSSTVLMAAAGLALLSPFALSHGIGWLAKLRRIDVPRRSPPEIITGLLPAYGFYVLFFAVSATILWSLAAVVGALAPSNLPLLAAALAAAWVAGYVTPGAAAGFGVREAVLIAALSGPLGGADAVLLAVSYRGATLLGDAVFFALSLPLTAPVPRVDS